MNRKQAGKVYIAAAFRRHSIRENSDQAYGVVDDQEYISLLEGLEDIFLRAGYQTCLPHRDEGLWGKVYYEPQAISSLCFRHVETSDVIFALAEQGRGVHLELGYAAALEKPLVCMFTESGEPSTLLWGLVGENPWNLPAGRHRQARVLPYSDRSQLYSKLAEVLGVDPVTSKSAKRSKVALIDIGSHTLKFKLYSRRAGARPAVLAKEQTSLGIMGEVLRTKKIGQRTIESILKVVSPWWEGATSRGVDSVMAVGTAALRKAEDTDLLVAALRESLGVDLHIIDAEEELGYLARGVLQTFEHSEGLGVLNLGGGSSQVGICLGEEVREKYLLDLGTRVITEKWPWDQQFSGARLEELQDWTRARVREAMGECTKVDGLVHTGGELDFLMRCEVPMETLYGSPVHVSKLTLDNFRDFAAQFAKLTPREVAARFGLDPAWAAGSVASNCIAIAVAEQLAASYLIPSNLNVSDGLVMHSQSKPT